MFILILASHVLCIFLVMLVCASLHLRLKLCACKSMMTVESAGVYVLHLCGFVCVCVCVCVLFALTPGGEQGPSAPGDSLGNDSEVASHAWHLRRSESRAQVGLQPGAKGKPCTC
jgi:hypothetical protein